MVLRRRHLPDPGLVRIVVGESGQILVERPRRLGAATDAGGTGSGDPGGDEGQGGEQAESDTHPETGLRPDRAHDGADTDGITGRNLELGIGATDDQGRGQGDDGAGQSEEDAGKHGLLAHRPWRRKS